MEINEERKISIVLADDHEVVRAGIRRLLIIDQSLVVIDEVSNGEDAVALVKYHKPDIALLDIFMPRMNGIEATKMIKTEIPDTMVVMLTAYEDAVHLEQALLAGADGYLTKDIGARQLIEALHNVMKGERVFSKSVLKILQKKALSYDREDADHVSITQREQVILNLIAKGKTSKEISGILNISLRTVQSHRSNIMQKLELKSSAGLVRYAVINYDKESHANLEH